MCMRHVEDSTDVRCDTIFYVEDSTLCMALVFEVGRGRARFGLEFHRGLFQGDSLSM